MSRRSIAALVIGAAAVTGVVMEVRDIARTEAEVSSAIIGFTGLADARPVGTAVIYQLGQRWVGFAITGGCSVALLMIPPLILTAVLIGLGRVRWRRGLAAAASAIGLLMVVNQVRLYLIASSMKWWGFQTGYERSHVLIGSGITTIGLALVTIIFMIFLAREPAGRTSRHAAGVRHAA